MNFGIAASRGVAEGKVRILSDPAQAAEYKRITAQIDPSIPVYAVPGNHDVGNEPTRELLDIYRQRFGRDYYSFREGEIC